jgi:drug/metabolite transporter (DMT)-like permease
LPGALRSLSSTLSRHSFSVLILIGANVLWASSYVAAKIALDTASLTMMLALRMCISGLVLFPFVWLKRKELHLTRSDLPQLALMSLIGFVINKLLEFGGLSLTTASDVALLITGESIFTAALSWIILREPFHKKSAFALIIGFLGVYLIVERSLIPNIPAGGGSLRIVGDLLVILALLFEASYTIRGKTLLVKHSPLLVTAASIVGSMAVWVPVAGWNVVTTGWPLLSWQSWVCVVWLAIGCTVLAYLAWFQGLTHVNASTASSTLFLQPLIGPVLGILLLHEALTPFTVIGGILIVISVYVISKQE